MPTLYKCEVFARDYTFRGFAPIERPSIAVDYLTLDKTTLSAVSIEAQKGDFVVVSDQYGASVYQGIIDDVEKDTTGSVTITALPLMSLFDTDVYFTRSESSQIETFIAGIITSNFISSGDSLQNVIGMTVETTSSTTGALNLKDNIHSFFEIVTKSLTAYGIAVNLELNVQKKTLAVTVGKVTDTATIEANLKAITEKNIILGDSYGELNKVTIYNKADEAQTVTYYLHTDGSVSTENTDRVTPVFFAAKFLDTEEDFGTAAYQKAYETLAPSTYNNLIELTTAKDSAVLDTSMKMGTEVLVIDGDKSYKSILTGYSITGNLVKMTFGVVRADLTKILILERRQTSDSSGSASVASIQNSEIDNIVNS